MAEGRELRGLEDFAADTEFVRLRFEDVDFGCASAFGAWAVFSRGGGVGRTGASTTKCHRQSTNEHKEKIVTRTKLVDRETTTTQNRCCPAPTPYAAPPPARARSLHLDIPTREAKLIIALQRRIPIIRAIFLHILDQQHQVRIPRERVLWVGPLQILHRAVPQNHRLPKWIIIRVEHPYIAVELVREHERAVLVIEFCSGICIIECGSVDELRYSKEHHLLACGPDVDVGVDGNGARVVTHKDDDGREDEERRGTAALR